MRPARRKNEPVPACGKRAPRWVRFPWREKPSMEITHVNAPISKVWIEAGCISCKLCQDMAPDVFLVEDDQTCIVHQGAAQHFGGKQEDIEEAARDCPVEVIKIEHQGAGD